jgi:hypothetical protein
MNTRYVALWKLHGANTLAAGNSNPELARLILLRHNLRRMFFLYRVAQ